MGALDDDMTSVSIDGAVFFESASDPYVRRQTIHRSGGRFLATISQGADGLFRVHLFARSTDHQYAGEYWGSIGDPSLTDSMDAAEAIARGRLDALDV